MDTVIPFLAALPWAPIAFYGTFAALSMALAIVASRQWLATPKQAAVAASGALAVAMLMIVHSYDTHRLGQQVKASHYLDLQVAELQHTLTTTQSVRDHLTAELEMAQDALNVGRRDLMALLSRVEKSLAATQLSLDQAKAELVVAQRDPGGGEANSNRTIHQRIETVLSEIERLGTIRARPSVKLEQRKPDVSADPVAILPRATEASPRTQ